MKSKEKKKKKQIIDDGRTISNMNVEGFKWYTSQKEQSARSKGEKLNLTFKERMAIVFGAYIAFLRPFLILLATFGILILIMYFWLS
ncbi:MAG TPA: hypothetical protein VJX95_04445 [Oscillospiraceae bacterium]|nr:hypothetical protein [Oscillospiraceae bacterium]